MSYFKCFTIVFLGLSWREPGFNFLLRIYSCHIQLSFSLSVLDNIETFFNRDDSVTFELFSRLIIGRSETFLVLQSCKSQYNFNSIFLKFKCSWNTVLYYFQVHIAILQFYMLGSAHYDKYSYHLLLHNVIIVLLTAFSMLYFSSL